MANPYLEVVLATIVFGTSGVFVKYLNLPATTLAFFRCFVPAVLIFGYFLINKRNLFRGNYKNMLFASTLNAIRMFFYFIAYNFTSIGNAVIMLYTWPIFASLFGTIILKEKITKKNRFLLSLAFIGIVLVFLNKEISFGNKDFIGMGAMLLAAMIYSLSFVIFKKELKTYTHFETVFYQNLVGAVVFIPFLFINQPLPTLTQSVVGSAYAILIGIVGMGLTFSALRRLKASTVSLLNYLEVVSAIIFGIILLGETLTWNMIVGGALIIGTTIMQKK